MKNKQAVFRINRPRYCMYTVLNKDGNEFTLPPVKYIDAAYKQ